MAYRAIVENLTTKQRLIVFPRSKKTSLFPTMDAAEKALDLRGRKLGAGWRGLIYSPSNDIPARFVAI